jgi:GTP-binding protein EngB required for normal cell division
VSLIDRLSVLTIYRAFALVSTHTLLIIRHNKCAYRSPVEMDHSIRNVIVFGESGGGKSSVINMLNGNARPLSVSDAAEGVVFNHTTRTKTISGQTYQVFETVSINKPGRKWLGKKDTRAAKEQLIRIIKGLDTGLNLLVYVMRAGEIMKTATENYRLFYEVVCEKQVPIVVVITKLESRANSERMDHWWIENEPAFDKLDLKFEDRACITATKGKLIGGEWTEQDLYDLSKPKVERLISNSCATEAWKMESKEPWTSTVLDSLRRML